MLGRRGGNPRGPVVRGGVSVHSVLKMRADGQLALGCVEFSRVDLRLCFFRAWRRSPSDCAPRFYPSFSEWMAFCPVYHRWFVFRVPSQGPCEANAQRRDREWSVRPMLIKMNKVGGLCTVPAVALFVSLFPSPRKALENVHPVQTASVRENKNVYNRSPE